MTLNDLQEELVGTQRKNRELPDVVARIMSGLWDKIRINDEIQNRKDHVHPAFDDNARDGPGSIRHSGSSHLPGRATQNKVDEMTGGIGRYGDYNLIPSSHYGHCTELLITLCCFESDSFASRLHESLDHASLTCKNTKDIYFITTKWETTIFDRALGHMELLRNSGMQFYFIYMSKNGIVQIPE